ncbi:MAG: YpdA family putative bacillithiol disulfide reductase [Saprospiraceae bacterium]|nr:YpdA family putative bacillithiol disulfide reductase [Saprospiraceae bacterium]
MNQDFDIVIIGAGPSGIATAIAAQKKKLNYIILEKGYLVNSIYNFPTNMTFFSTSIKLEIGNTPFISHVEKPTRKEALEYYRRVVKSKNLNIKYQSEVNNIRGNENGFIVRTKERSYKTKYVIVATGYYDKPRLLNIEGEGLSKVKHYYDDAHPYIGMDVLVVGAANSACDVALETWQKGANVTMVVRGSELYKKVKYWILPNIENRIKEGSIKAYFNSELLKIEQEQVVMKTPEGSVKIKNDYVLAMTGYMPNYKFLESIGINISESKDKVPEHNPNTFETNIPNLYIAGVISAGLNTSQLFIENTRDHGEIIIHDILSKMK